MGQVKLRFYMQNEKLNHEEKKKSAGLNDTAVHFMGDNRILYTMDNEITFDWLGFWADSTYYLACWFPYVCFFWAWWQFPDRHFLNCWEKSEHGYGDEKRLAQWFVAYWIFFWATALCMTLYLYLSFDLWVAFYCDLPFAIFGDYFDYFAEPDEEWEEFWYGLPTRKKYKDDLELEGLEYY